MDRTSPTQPRMHAIGSSYLLRQSAGGEQYAGATVKICPKRADKARVEIRLTAYHDQSLIDDCPEFLRESATQAVELFARRHGELSAWDIEIFDFAYHEVDTSPRTTFATVYNALVSAFSAWRIRLSEPTDDRGEPSDARESPS